MLKVASVVREEMLRHGQKVTLNPNLKVVNFVGQHSHPDKIA